jgi:hypothetical protein
MDVIYDILQINKDYPKNGISVLWPLLPLEVIKNGYNNIWR